MAPKIPQGLESFNLQKYKNQTNLSVQDWISLIESRLVVKSFMSGPVKQKSLHKDDIIGISFKDFAKPLLDSILETPLSPLGEKIRSLVKRPWNQSNVQSIAENKVFHFYRAVVEKNKNYLVASSDSITNELVPGPVLSHEIGDLHGSLDDALRNSTFYNLPHLVNYSVDIRGDTKKIIDDFKRKLTVDRKKYKVADSSITDSQLKKWCEHQVLAYSDLRLWSQFSGQILSDDVVQILLHQKEMTRQQETVSKYYDDVISTNTLRELSRTLDPKKTSPKK